MIDRASLCRRLHALERYTLEIERLAATIQRQRFDTDLSTQWMVEHGLQLAVECVLDIGSHPVAAEGMGAPESYREVLELLGARGDVVRQSHGDEPLPRESRDPRQLRSCTYRGHPADGGRAVGNAAGTR